MDPEHNIIADLDEKTSTQPGMIVQRNSKLLLRRLNNNMRKVGAVSRQQYSSNNVVYTLPTTLFHYEEIVYRITLLHDISQVALSKRIFSSSSLVPSAQLSSR